ncbi:RING finger protein [Coccidioides immitis RS]|uniref:RING finger protein n=4 Tax=Coccidioides immitis TaxID=5501 RepID=J3K611_COCIM|nr:RING finger protein [Coccidioides immitis RS]EAS29948.3 RING finger protein [Coccidioides immitis RS]TPX22211.1 hypothetical protein DIZ76_014077 [Coccidioides immitis]
MVFFPPFLRASKSPHSSGKGPPSSGNASTASLAPPSSVPITTASASSSSSSSAMATPASATLIEALRNNPFGTAGKSKCPATILNNEEEKEQERAELNKSLVILAELFPDVKIEVFRELLVRFDGDSRLQVCVEQLLRYRNEWVKGRWNVPTATDTDSTQTSKRVSDKGGKDSAWTKAVPEEEMFRSDHYKKAVKTALCQEFRSISRSAIDAVLAEVNYSYTRARPTLRHLSRKTWRVTLGNILSFKKSKEKDEPPLLVWQRQPNGDIGPHLKGTGSAELDGELHTSFVVPLLARKKESQEDEDLRLAHELNEVEAQAADALYECSCCLSDIAFEQISMCSESSHVICFTCIQRTVHEALFGQGWGNSVNTEKSTLRCLAPLQNGACNGLLDTELVKRAILADKSGCEAYQKFESRIAEESLLKSQLKLVRCPFCSYAEYDPVYHPSPPGLTWRFRRASVLPTICMIMVLLDMIPFLIVLLTAFLLLYPSTIPLIFSASVRNLCLRTRNQRFTCSNPTCGRDSCVTCHKPWQDPHICHEPLLLNLRTTVEAARTAAIKRTCPRCGLSFVKSSGCNKLTCVCGYSMCYLCRKALGPPVRQPGGNGFRPGRLRDQENLALLDAGFDGPVDLDEQSDEELPDDEEEGEGYKHFCEHFRINPGSRCTECNKCDLYMAEDEEAVAQRAGEKAEREWRYRQGLTTGPVPHHFGIVNAQLHDNRGRKSDPRTGRVFAPWEWNWKFDPKDWKARCRFWVKDVWRDERWKGEAQYLVDRIVEILIVVET